MIEKIGRQDIHGGGQRLGASQVIRSTIKYCRQLVLPNWLSFSVLKIIWRRIQSSVLCTSWWCHGDNYNSIVLCSNLNFSYNTCTTNYKIIYLYHTSECLIFFKYLNVWYMAQRTSLIPFGFWHYYFHRGTSMYLLISMRHQASRALTSWISQLFKCKRIRNEIIVLIISTRETTDKSKRKMLRHVHFVSIYKSCQASNVMIMLLIVKLTRRSCSFFHKHMAIWTLTGVLLEVSYLSKSFCSFVPVCSHLNQQPPFSSLIESRQIHSTQLKF